MEINYRKLLIEAGLQQKELAEIVNLNPVSLSKIFTYTSDPKFSNVVNILDALGYELELKKK